MVRHNPLRRRGIGKSSRADMPDACILYSFLLRKYIRNGTKLRKIATLVETGKN